jgi:hypothetical protein
VLPVDAQHSREQTQRIGTATVANTTGLDLARKGLGLLGECLRCLNERSPGQGKLRLIRESVPVGGHIIPGCMMAERVEALGGNPLSTAPIDAAWKSGRPPPADALRFQISRPGPSRLPVGIRSLPPCCTSG